ncbi:N-acetylmuramoyl-L-alanine amidase family protein [Fervidibacter sp.]
MRVVWLKGDYVGNHERQRQASKANCRLVLSFHFNAADPKAQGSEVFSNGKGDADYIAAKLLHLITDILGTRSRGVKPAAGSRAGFLRFYPCPAVLMEPCFITNPEEANLVHDVQIVRQLGEAIADALVKWLPYDATVGLDIGHKFKTSQPNDRGARCFYGDFEADHAEQLAKVVAASLQLRTKEVVQR